MRLAISILCLLPSLPARADSWTKADTALEGSFAALLIADYFQTRQITDDGMESNPIIGDDGRTCPPEIYFPAIALAHFAVARTLPGRWRTLFQGVTIGLEIDTIHTNLEAGYGFTW